MRGYRLGLHRHVGNGKTPLPTLHWLIVSGNIGVKEIERLIKKLELDKEILADQSDDEGGQDGEAAN